MRAALLAAVLVLVAAAPASAAPALVKIGDFDSPVHVASPPKDPRVFVVEQAGLVKIAGGGTFLDVTGRTNGGGEEGLLSIAFPPNYAASGLFYVFLTTPDGGALHVIEFRRSATNPNVADPSTARVVLNVPHPLSAGNHNGGQLQFGPDGYLYVSTGDGATGSNAQALGSELGKILRIDARTGAAAPGNPFGSRVWAYGLRNPWRFTFDRATGDLLIGDVGEVTWEEVDWATAASGRGRGVNYGWPCAEGPAGEDSCGTRPAFSRGHDDGYAAIAAGYVVRDPGLPTLNGRFLYGDYAVGSLQSVALPDDAPRAEPLAVSQLTSFGEDACARIYAASHAGPVYRIQDGAPTRCTFPAPVPVTPQGGSDTVAPSLRVRILRASLKHRRLRLAVTCSEACRIAVGSRLRRVRKLKTRHRSLAAGKRTLVRIGLTRKTTRKLRRRLNRRGYVRLAVTIHATDAAGNTAVVTRRGRLMKRR